MTGHSITRCALTILLFLLAGAVVNIAVAWGCAIWTRGDDRSCRYSAVRAGAQDWILVRHEVSGSTVIISDRRPAVPGQYNASATPDELAVHWADVEHALVQPVQKEYRRIEARGWPCRAFRLERRYIETGGDPIDEWRATIDIGLAEQGWGGWAVSRSLPLQPIWLGFGVNTLFYGAVLWLGFCGPFRLRGHLRVKRGRCIMCGYDLRGELDAGCPECGWQREGTAKETPRS